MNLIRYQLSFFRIIPLLVMMLSCSKDEDPANRKRTGYFDLKQFFEQKIADLEQRKPEVVKTVLLNGEKQEMTLTIQDWGKELSAFIQADIDKPAFVEKYEVDTTVKDNGKVVRFEAKEKDLKTRLLQITYDSASIQPSKVEVKMATRNILYQSTQDLVYEPAIGYRISGMQSVKFLKEDHFEIVTKF